MPGYVDPLIGLHFKDRVEVFGPEQECLVSFVPGADIASITAELDATLTARGVNVAAVRASPLAQLNLQDSASTLSVVPLARPPRIAVLVRLRNPVWDAALDGFVRGSQLGNVVTGTATSAAIAALARDANVISVEPSLVVDAAECAQSMPFIKADVVHRPPVDEKGSEALVAVVDVGVDVLHEAFLDPTAAGPARSRIVALWDQTSDAGPTPKQASAAGHTGSAVYTQDYGSYHSRVDIAGYIAAGAVPAGLLRDPEKHGTHVASIAAGSAVAAFPGGVAPEADIVFVIPKMTPAVGDPVSLGYSVSHVDALAFIKETARALDKPVAVNVSLGMNAGAHDGTSLLELAFDEFSGGGRVPGLVIVKSAGNEQLQDIHAQVTVAHGATARVAWDSTAVPRPHDLLEFWSASNNDLGFTLRAPGGGTVTVDRATPAAQANLPGGETCYLRFERFHHDNGDARLIVLVRRNGNRALTLSGRWQLEIRGNAVPADGGRVDGWIERDRSRAARFVVGQVTTGTVSIPGTARTVICVGACDLSAVPIVQPFSSHGPARDERRKPELVAPGHNIIAAQAGTSTGLMAMPGTSMAAPHVTGAVALLLSLQRRRGGAPLNAAQIRSALSQCIGGFSGAWNSGAGYGWLDVPALLAAFD